MQGGASGKVLQMEREIVTVQYNYDVAIVGSGVAVGVGAGVTSVVGSGRPEVSGGTVPQAARERSMAAARAAESSFFMSRTSHC